ncbi:GspH/FimT family pseudopilin [Entomomonas asaccharolytica]|uniref:Type II secretion system protein H n=1 Tax=Entomomonas asaccharolytica TaxID=2785331 RepID=A0A974NEG9_9GAMM|nr:GspH/FimT family pseudopilin [Entomomonas asaccharolytica]QQP85156.1 prepilin-type N-terminal cleavage/methylation domain-containing protein [Entomomonas asaccharolytica]
MKIFKEKGFTALELMMVIVIVAVLTVIAVPNFSSVSKKNAITATTNELVGLLQYAKTAAVTHNNPVIVCPFTQDSDEYVCEDDFTKSKKIGVFLYASPIKDRLREMTLANSIVITNRSTGSLGKVIAFYPDSSSAIHGIPDSFVKYNDNGAYVPSTGLTLNKDYFPKGAGTVKWKITAKTSAATEKCNVMNVSAIGQSRVEQESCSND